MTLREIVKKFLEDNGFDGLFSEYDCACEKDDLMPCDEPRTDCQPGYKTPCPADCGDHDWHIAEKKESV
jgi:hypothetical protein